MMGVNLMFARLPRFKSLRLKQLTRSIQIAGFLDRFPPRRRGRRDYAEKIVIEAPEL